jgi:3-hydroxybutyryl-CoA dehydrogenase
MSVEVRTVAVICAELLGRKLAYAAAIHGYQTVLKDASEARLARAMADFADTLDYQLRQGQITAVIHSSAPANLAVAPSIEDALRRADLIVDTVHDEAEVKLELFSLFDKFALPDAILISTCSASISVSELAAVTFCPERCIGISVQQRQSQPDLFELVKGLHSSDRTVAKCVAFLRDIGEECIARCEPPGPDQTKPPAVDKSAPDSAAIISELPWAN